MAYIPPCFTDDGPSWPRPLRVMFGVMSVVRPRMMAAYYYLARLHDYGYWYARLDGSGLEHLTKHDFDLWLKQSLMHKGHAALARISYKAVASRFGDRAYRRAGARMRSDGDFTLNDYLARHGYVWTPPHLRS